MGLENFFQRYFYSWRFNGWLRHDITLAIVIGVGILLLLFIMFKHRRVGAFVIAFISYAFFSSFVMIVFGLAGRSFPINAVSPVYADDSQNIAIQMVRGTENNGTSNGITQLISHYQIIAIDLKSGEKQWTNSSSGKETIIGPFMGGLLIHHRDGEVGKLSLLNIQTGKEELSKKEFAQKHKSLIDILDQGTYNLMVWQNKLYLEGIDGKYYQFDGKNLSEDSEAENLLSARFSLDSDLPNDFDSHIEKEEYQEIEELMSDLLAEPAIQSFENLGVHVLDVNPQDKTAIVTYQETKRESANRMIFLYDMNEHRILFEENIGAVNAEQKVPGLRVLKSYYAIQAGDEFILLDKKTGKEILRYHLRWNIPVYQN